MSSTPLQSLHMAANCAIQETMGRYFMTLREKRIELYIYQINNCKLELAAVVHVQNRCNYFTMRHSSGLTFSNRKNWKK